MKWRACLRLVLLPFLSSFPVRFYSKGIAMGYVRTIGLLLFVLLSGCDQPATPPSDPVVAEVVTVTLAETAVPVESAFVAQVRSSHHVEIMARVSGFLEKIVYREGALVTAGQVMFRLDPKPFQAQVDSAHAEVAIRQAQLETAEANLARIQPLAALDAASKSDLDNATGQVKAAAAALAEARTRVQKAELELGYTTIKAPLTGIAGQSLLREGAYIAATGPTAGLTYVARLDPVWVEFSVSQNEMARSRQEVNQGLIQLPEKDQYQIELELSDGSRYPHTGSLDFADPSFSQQTGTFLVRAQLANPEGELRPGMFVKALVQGATRPHALLVPQRAVLQTPNGQIVFVVSTDGRAEPRPVKVGEWIDENWVINQGLQPGDQVIVDGFMRLAPGMPVKVVSTSALPAATPAAARN